jgi:hypothetical protein
VELEPVVSMRTWWLGWRPGAPSPVLLPVVAGGGSAVAGVPLCASCHARADAALRRTGV